MHLSTSSLSTLPCVFLLLRRLCLYSLLRFFFEVKCATIAELEPQLASYRAACTVVDLILLAKRRTADPQQAGEALGRAVGVFMDAHRAAYGARFLRPKRHWLMDIPAQIVRDRCSIDAFVVERQHLMVKHVADHIDNTTTFERSVMGSVCSVVFSGDGFPNDGLQGRTAMWPGMPGVRVGDKMLTFGLTVCTDDFVTRGGDVGKVVAVAQDCTSLYAVVETLSCTRNVTSFAQVHQPSGSHEIWAAAELEQCVTWWQEPDGQWVVLRM